ncbi:pantothenate synthetase [Flavobacterium suaedae]|uniref:Pantothenate synthetase n=1 Tax=Flavobacterium suaedae TaxID=1767027 RepID=A0ABQ1JUK2_9FLAO|nr:pantoate--beta-alanine ligase [Flavobacterium suaedae]GGB78489.1 pantothenate synthetase [Flavobacterium suaedae]
MLIFNNKADLRAHLSPLAQQGKTIGFVPTMGALHKGHLSLIERSVQNNAATVVSIFVNPTQFNNPHDLEKYPRTPEADIEKIKTVSDDIIVFLPSVEEMYEGNTKSQTFSFDGLEHQMEGAYRPGHFDGVGTIVKKFFEYVHPTRAYFGEKDFQQLQIVKKLVSKNNIPVEIIGCPISREENGLAMSSRNQRLTENEKEQAAFIYKKLLEAKDNFTSQSIEAIKQQITTDFNNQEGFELEYFEIAAEDDLIPAKTKDNRKYRAFVAVMLSNVRLIDNISLN